MNHELQKTFGHRLRVRASGISVTDNRVLLVGMSGLVEGMLYWCPPGGGVKFGESVRDAVEREILEETGLRATTGRFMFFREYLNPPLHALELYFEASIEDFSGLGTGKDPELEEGQQLITEAALFTLEELNRLPRKGLDPVFHHLPSLDYLCDAAHWLNIQKELI